MRKFLLSAAVSSLLLGTPVLAQTVSNLPFGSDEPQSQIQWQNLVDKANANRLGLGAGAAAAAQGNTAAIKGPTATDANHGAPALVAPSLGYWQTGHYHSALEVKQDR